MSRPVILLSGGFDPYHDGHARMFMEAADIGRICVILNSDDWLVKKKGKYFMTLNERADVLSSVRGVEQIWESKTLSDVSEDLVNIRKHIAFKDRELIFAKGGDRTQENTPEIETCKKLGIKVIFGLGGNNNQSSSVLLAKYVEKCV